MRYFLLIFIISINSCTKENYLEPQDYPLHTDITVTFFWVGEKGSDDNKDIPNEQSVWDDEWKQNFGGVDNPDNRNGYFPAEFIPNENPFYFALPYNDFKSSGNRKKTSLKRVYWGNKKSWDNYESLCKNQWIKIIKDDTLVCYAQWEDAGPFGENDYKYVFGTDKPKNKINENAGLDVSPAVRDYLSLGDINKVDWQFVAENSVPDGPWKQIITTSQINWK